MMPIVRRRASVRRSSSPPSSGARGTRARRIARPALDGHEGGDEQSPRAPSQRAVRRCSSSKIEAKVMASPTPSSAAALAGVCDRQPRARPCRKTRRQIDEKHPSPRNRITSRRRAADPPRQQSPTPHRSPCTRPLGGRIQVANDGDHDRLHRARAETLERTKRDESDQPASPLAGASENTAMRRGHRRDRDVSEHRRDTVTVDASRYAAPTHRRARARRDRYDGGHRRRDDGCLHRRRNIARRSAATVSPREFFIEVEGRPGRKRPGRPLGSPIASSGVGAHGGATSVTSLGAGVGSGEAAKAQSCRQQVLTGTQRGRTRPREHSSSAGKCALLDGVRRIAESSAAPAGGAPADTSRETIDLDARVVGDVSVWVPS